MIWSYTICKGSVYPCSAGQGLIGIFSQYFTSTVAYLVEHLLCDRGLRVRSPAESYQRMVLAALSLGAKH